MMRCGFASISASIRISQSSMGAAQRHCKFVAGGATQRAGLHVPKMMMRIRLPAAAHEARLLSDIGQMLPVAIPARCGNREDGSCRCREADDFGE